MQLPLTHEEINALIPKLKKELSDYEAEQPGIKPLPPMTKEECLDYLFRLMDRSEERPLKREETFILGQLLAQLEQAIIAETLGKKGRYYVVSEEMLMKRFEK